MLHTDLAIEERLRRLAAAGQIQTELANRLGALARTQFQRIASDHGEKLKKRGEGLLAANGSPPAPHDLALAWQNYVVDAAQRSVLFLDVLRQRGDDYLAHVDAGMPPVLDFAFETIIDGRSLSRPVNYSLVRITPPQGVTVDEAKRPFMIVDPRAGHGAGIGGFKPDSQVGEAFEDGHTVYFVVFRPIPEPGQTLADVRDAEIVFLREIIARHPQAPRPAVIGNCQGGWAAMLLAASAPELVGVVSINGAPMSYWAGTVGKNPMRYMGGLNGGALPALLISDLGNGVFDGSSLVMNFESQNPGNTWWRKYYDLYANVDTEAQRFLDFERWWGGFFMMTEDEIAWIVQNLFIGNRLGRGEAKLGQQRIDLKKITAPILVFASHGDNITPPQQALNWIADLYRDEQEIKARGQKIVYMVHPTIGHLGIFVSAKIAGREHDAITDTMRAIEALAPGLYEMKLDDAPDRLHIRFEPRRIDDILALDDGREDEELFASVARLSELSTELYDVFVRPTVRAMVTPASADMFFASQPLRTRRIALSSRNPAVAPVPKLAETVRRNRQPAALDNPFRRMETFWAESIEQSWNLVRDMREVWMELTFHAIYGAPALRAIGERSLVESRVSATEDLRALPQVQAALARIDQGGSAEAIVRMLVLLSEARGYVRRSRLERTAKLFADIEPFASMTDAGRAEILHTQSLIVDFEPEKALGALPDMIPTQADRRFALDVVMSIAGPENTMHPAALRMYRQFEAILIGAGSVPAATPVATAPVPQPA
jgi:pimeloyl-ACP methyl ester carboxylesterase